ncbi:MAG TPA: 16S rRNA (adenine(1518)-N(6)/adenine(1519)-N(6))-dimethyltransferase RsmA [Jiangellaceae bacterium]|nr:16S rRNA (adenine(1518)-N(6)/adenine(1519)-N(6))-dimethyltransferase RsmA [Jiangellaceae bacterium]
MVRGQPSAASRLLGPADVRRLAEAVGLRPSKSLGQNFVVDANTVRRIVRLADVGPDDVVLEVGPGLGSLTLALLPEVARVVAVEVDSRLADALPATVREFGPTVADRLSVVTTDALRIQALPEAAPTVLVANLPYNVAVPVLLHLLETFPTLERGLVMMQKEVADRLAASPGSRTYGVPSVKTAWYARVRQVGTVARTVFWPTPNVDSGLVALERRDPPAGADRREVFAVVDAAFAQRRKTLRAALAGWAGSPARAEEIVHRAGVDPGVRGERLAVEDFVRIARAAGSGHTASGSADR